MSALVATLLTWQKDLAMELQRFILLWRYQHQVPLFALGWRLLLKRVVDVIGAAIGLVLTAPLLLLLAIALRLDSPGPALYRQQRVGRFGDRFTMYKLRTMRLDAEANGPIWAAGDRDPRMTRLGRILRRTHLDELPQLLNVLRGDMSLVGPRPERPAFVDRLRRDIRRYDQRLLVKPGMTGLA